MPITVIGNFAVFDGLGGQNEYMVRGMARSGAQVNPWPLDLIPEGLSEEFVELLARSRPRLDGPVVLVAGGRFDHASCLVGSELFIRQPWETSRFPAEWVAHLNRAHLVVATTLFVADVLRDSGVEVPIEVVPDGIDPQVYRYEPRPERERFTTLVVGRNLPRKHHAEAVAGWQQAFEGDPNARLIIKTMCGPGDTWRPPADDSRIRFVNRCDARRGLAQWYRDADVLLALGNEGTGLPMLEAMATGLPVVALVSEGQGEVCSAIPDAVLAVRPARWQACRVRTEDLGVRGVPDVGQVAAHLRWVAGHRAEAAEMGRSASEWVRQHRNVWNYGADVLDLITGYSRYGFDSARRKMIVRVAQ